MGTSAHSVGEVVMHVACRVQDRYGIQAAGSIPLAVWQSSYKRSQ